MVQKILAAYSAKILDGVDGDADAGLRFFPHWFLSESAKATNLFSFSFFFFFYFIFLFFSFLVALRLRVYSVYTKFVEKVTCDSETGVSYVTIV